LFIFPLGVRVSPKPDSGLRESSPDRESFVTGLAVDDPEPDRVRGRDIDLEGGVAGEVASEGSLS
jgi:hypothetical protein